MAIDPTLLAHAEAARGFMPADEGLALFDAAEAVAVPGAWLEVGSYCGKSAVYIGAAAKAAGRVLFALDHHRGSEENQAGWEHHEPDLVDPEIGKMDTLPIFRRTIHDAGLEGTVVGLVGAEWGNAQPQGGQHAACEGCKGCFHGFFGWRRDECFRNSTPHSDGTPLRVQSCAIPVSA